jgi:hypothetical protein
MTVWMRPGTCTAESSVSTSRKRRVIGVVLLAGLLALLKFVIQLTFDSDWAFGGIVGGFAIAAMALRAASRRKLERPEPGKQYECAIGGCTRLGPPDSPFCEDHGWVDHRRSYEPSGKGSSEDEDRG